MKKIIWLLFVASSLLLLWWCDMPPQQSLPQQPISYEPSIWAAEQAVLDEWYTEPRVDWISLVWCSEEYSMLTSRVIFAKNVNGKEVRLRVCCGLIFTWCSIRH